MKLNIHEKLFSTKGSTPYESVLREVQSNIATRLPKSVEEITESELKDIIEKYITEHRVKCNLTDSVPELANYIYHDMAGLSFISREKLLEKPGFEELNINAWNDVDMNTGKGLKKTEYSFLSPQHAMDIHQRMLRKTRTVFDDAMPLAVADIGEGIRICALKYPIVDKNIGVASSIRKVSLSVISKESIVEYGTATQDMLDFLLLCLNHGVSMCISGETGAGKTTLAGGLLSEVSKRKRTITIEEGSREWDFIQKNSDGKILNSVVHLKTKPNDEIRLMIDQEALVKAALRLDPDIIAPGEIRGREAFEVMGVSNTGHTVITTVHSNGATDTPERMVTLAKKAFDMSDKTLYSMAARAFSILVHTEKLTDGKRRVTEIYEVTGYKDEEIIGRQLFEYVIYDNIYENDDKDSGNCMEVKGEFVQLNPISDNLVKKLLKKGARRKDILPFLMEKGDDKCS